MKLANALISLGLMATTAHGFRDQSQKKAAGQHHRALEQVCSIDHDKAQTGAELTVDIKAVPDRGTSDPNGLFTITIFDPPYAHDNGLPMSTYGWCIDYDRFISSGEYVMDILSAYDSDVHTDAVDKPDMFPNLAWLINNVNVGDKWEARDGCQGKDALTWYEMQGAVWKLIDDKDGEGTFYKRRRVDCVSEQIAEKARTLGSGYQLDCNDPFEQIPLVMIVDHDVTGEILNQVIVSETPLSSIPGMCVCEELEPEPAPTVSPRNFPAPPREGACKASDVLTLDFETDGQGKPTHAGQLAADLYSNLGIDISTHDSKNKPAMLFDTKHPTGGDNDLYHESEGMVLIISEDADSSDPDDNARGGSIFMEFETPVCFMSMGMFDIEEEGDIFFFDDAGSIIKEQELPTMRDGEMERVELDLCGIYKIEITMTGSGAFTDIELCMPTDTPDSPAPTGSPREFPAPPKEETCKDEMREDACGSNDKCDDNAVDLPMGVIEHWDVASNIGCVALGFDFGFKTGDPGCFDEDGSPFEADGNSLEVTNDRGCTDCSMPVDAKYSVTCSNPDGNQFKEAKITANVDMYVYVKAKGGYLYKYEAGSTLDVITPDNKAISHMDFCFVCPGPEIKTPMCTSDVKECSDGSFVSRTGPNCEFEACPNPECTADYECPQPMCLPGVPCPYYICQGEKCVPQYPETPEPRVTEAPTEAPGCKSDMECPQPRCADGVPCPYYVCQGGECIPQYPETPAPTEPTSIRVGEPTPAPSKGSGSGDPHFKTWTGDKYDYHGECDLVLVDNPRFNNGQGLKLHIRTTRVKYFSFIERAALQIGDDVLEFANDAENFLINGKPVEANRKHHKTLLGGFVVRRDKKAVSIRFQYSTHGHARIDFHTRKNGFPAVIVDGAGTDIFQGSLGLLGDWDTGKRMARDGKTELYDEEDATAFALEWQVQDTEPMLFQESRFPQFPATCTPPKKILGGRLGMSRAKKQAEEACAHWKEDKEDCIFDVIATRDVLVAAEGSIHHVVE